MFLRTGKTFWYTARLTDVRRRSEGKGTGCFLVFCIFRGKTNYLEKAVRHISTSYVGSQID